jgi:TolA-binding protein
MARPQQRNLVERLADAGEEAIQKLGEAPGGERLVGAVNAMRDRVDEMQKKLRGLDEIDKRLRAIERRLDKLEGKAPAGTRKRATSSTREPKSSSSG